MILQSSFGEALAHISALTEVAPGKATYFAKLAWYQWELGQQEGARQSPSHAARLDPGNLTLLYVRGLMQE